MARPHLKPARSIAPLALLLLLPALPALPSAAVAAEPLVVDRDVSYDLGTPPGDPALNQLDIYRSTGAGRSLPIVVYVHGGGWSVGDKANSIANKAQLFADAGYLFVSVNYRLSPEPPDPGNPSRLRFPAHPNDLAEAIAWLGRNAPAYGGDPDRLILIGHSAGAHLVSLVSTKPSFLRSRGIDPLAIRGTVALDTATLDLTRRADPATSTLSPRGLLVLWNAIATPAENELDGAWAAASPLLHADRRDPPHLLVVQGNPLRLAENLTLADALELDRSEHVLALDASHRDINVALGDPADRSGETEAVSAFVASALAVESAPKPRLQRKPPRRVRIGARKRRARVGFRFAVGDERARFECRIDRRRWRRCSSPRRYRLGPGKHRFRVSSKTRDGRSETRNHRFRVVRR